MKSIKLGNVLIPLLQYASQGNAVLGIRDSGKSYTSTYIGEQLHENGIPFITFDPSGVWKFLRVAGKGKGLPIVVAGGKTPDIPLTPQSAPEIVRAAMRGNVSLVLDLYDIHMSKADWSRIVESCVRVLLYENGEYGLRHIFIEEGAEFAPQNVTPDKAKVYAEVEKLARIGGNALLGYTLINQRAEQVNKAVLELCDCLILHRQKGKNSLNSLTKWLDYSDGGNVKEIIKSLPTLPQGESWLWASGSVTPVHCKTPEKSSFHPDRRALIANPSIAQKTRVDVASFVSSMKENLALVLKESEANDPIKLKQRITELERAQRSSINKTALPAEQTKAVNDALQKGENNGYAKALGHFQKTLKTLVKTLHDTIDTWNLSAVPVAPLNQQVEFVPKVPEAARLANLLVSPPIKREGGRCIDDPYSEREKLSKAQRAILDSLAWLSDKGIDRPHRKMLAAISNYRGGHYTNNLGALKTAMLIEYPNTSAVQLTPEGQLLAQLKIDIRPIHQQWMDGMTTAEKKVFLTLIDAYPNNLSREQISKISGYKGGHFTNTLGALRTKGAINYPFAGMVCLTEYVTAELGL